MATTLLSAYKIFGERFWIEKKQKFLEDLNSPFEALYKWKFKENVIHANSFLGKQKVE